MVQTLAYASHHTRTMCVSGQRVLRHRRTATNGWQRPTSIYAAEYPTGPGSRSLHDARRAKWRIRSFMQFNEGHKGLW